MMSHLSLWCEQNFNIFCTLFFVCDPLAGSLVLHLLDWVRLHKADVDEKAREVLASESPAEHQAYWDVVRTHTQLSCLSLHF